MVRIASTVLLIWALIMQPLIAAVPMQIADTKGDLLNFELKSEPPASINSYKFRPQSGDIASLPCHQVLSSQESVVHCANCDVDCSSSGLCVSSCAVLGAAAIQKIALSFAFKNNILLTTSSNAAIYGLPSRIFHPPKRL